MDYEDFLDLAKTRRSIRKFKSDPIPEGSIDRIIEAARWAPSGANSQPWEFVIITEQKLKDGITQIIKEAKRAHFKGEESDKPVPPPHPQGGINKAPVFILLLGDTRAKIALPGKIGEDEKKWRSVLTSSLASAFLYMSLAATTLGLASQWQSAVESPEAEGKIKELLGIPESMYVYEMMVLGYPDMQPGPKRMRENSEITHINYCGENSFRSDEEAITYYKKNKIR